MEPVATLVRSGGVIAYPTDTVWGLGGDARRPDVIARVRALKGRDRRPMLVLADTAARVAPWVASVPEPLARVLTARLPATVLLDASPRAPRGLVGEEGWIGVRCPDGWVGDLCRTLALPLLSTSANVSGEPTPTSRTDLPSRIVRGVDHVADGPEPTGGAPSTLVHADGDALVVVRVGAVSVQDLAAVAGCEVSVGGRA